jgi:hypothetical protein
MSDIKFGFVLPIYLYNPERVAWAKRSFASLRKTQAIDHMPILLFVAKSEHFDAEGLESQEDFPGFGRVIIQQPYDAANIDAAVTYGFDSLFRMFPEITHGCFLADDFIYNPVWLSELRALILRHPDAKSWSVYRSGNTKHHRTLQSEGVDMLVTSISGPGAITWEEWKDWNFDYRKFPVGISLDILHSRERIGDRWVTQKSYIQQIGVRGMHNTDQECDTSLDFVGEM